MNKRIVAIIMGCVLFIACVSFSYSFAWFTDSDQVVNKIKLGKFGIEVSETSNSEDAVISDNGITYTKPIVPGEVKSKVLEIANTKELDVYLKVEIIKIWKDHDGNILEDKDPDVIELQGIDESIWLQAENGENGELNYYLKNKLTPGETVKLFDSFKLDSKLSLSDEIRYDDSKAEIIVNVTALKLWKKQFLNKVGMM